VATAIKGTAWLAAVSPHEPLLTNTNTVVANTPHTRWVARLRSTVDGSFETCLAFAYAIHAFTVATADGTKNSSWAQLGCTAGATEATVTLARTFCANTVPRALIRAAFHSTIFARPLGVAIAMASQAHAVATTVLAILTLDAFLNAAINTSEAKLTFAANAASFC